MKKCLLNHWKPKHQVQNKSMDIAVSTIRLYSSCSYISLSAFFCPWFSFIGSKNNSPSNYGFFIYSSHLSEHFLILLKNKKRFIIHLKYIWTEMFILTRKCWIKKISIIAHLIHNLDFLIQFIYIFLLMIIMCIRSNYFT